MESSAAKTISRYCEGDYVRFYHMCAQPFRWEALDDFGEISRNNMWAYFTKNEGRMLEDMDVLASEMHFIVPEQSNDNSLNGLKFCITGSFSQSRDELKKRLEAKGAKFVSSVSKNLDVLFCGAKAGSKLTKAQQLGIRVAGEDELMKMLGE